MSDTKQSGKLKGTIRPQVMLKAKVSKPYTTSGDGCNCRVDKFLSIESENPVENKIITAAIFDIYKRLEALESGIVVVNNTAKLGTAILGKMILGKGA